MTKKLLKSNNLAMTRNQSSVDNYTYLSSYDNFLSMPNCLLGFAKCKKMSKNISKFGNVKLHGLFFTFGPLRSVWPTLFLLNVFTALKGTHFYIWFNGNLKYISKDSMCIYKILISQQQRILEYVMWYQIRLKTYFVFHRCIFMQII